MPKRPVNTDASFLAHIFSPKKQPLPTGLRKGKPLKTTAGRKPARVNAFNRMPTVNQEILKRSGLRDAYLKGETTLAEAKRSLRPQAISLGAAKPVRSRAPKQVRPVTPLDILIRTRFLNKVRDAGRPVNTKTVATQFQFVQPEQGMLTWEYPEFKYAGRDGSEYEVVDSDGHRHNPFWYH